MRPRSLGLRPLLGGALGLVALWTVDGCRAGALEGESQEQAFGECAIPGAALSRVFAGVSFRKPTSMVQDPSDPTRFYVTEKEGLIKTITTATGAAPVVFADLSAKIAFNGAEPGINGIAFHPSFPTTNEVYVAYDGHNPQAKPPLVDFEWTLSRFKTKAGPGGVAVLDTASEEILIRIDKYDSEHNGGSLVFKNEGGKNLLYVSVGDGSPANEQIQNHPEIKPAQDTRALLGKMLRLDVAARQDGHLYGYPSDNPFGTAGTKPGQGRPEIYAWGLRNPWRFSFDSKKPDDLWLGDVGQDAYEEVDLVKKGGNYGWLPKEATHCSNADAERRRLGGDPNACPVPDEVLPVVEYPHNGQSAAVIGGFVYHGKSAPALEGTYVFGDYVSGNVFGLVTSNGKPKIQTIGKTGKAISSFAQDKDGEVYVLDHAAGQVFKIVTGPCADGGGQSAPPYKWLVREGVGDQVGAVAYYAGFQNPAVVVGTYTLQQFGTDNLGVNPNERDPSKLAAAGQTTNRGTYRNRLDLGFVREMVCSKPAAFTAAGQAFKAGTADAAPPAGCFVRNWRSLTDYQDFVEGRTDGTATLGTVAMSVENGFTHFYVFNAQGLLATQATLDSEGPKFMPQLCTPCHSGQYRGKGGAVNIGSIFREFEPDSLDVGGHLVFNDPSGQTKFVPSDAATAQAEWFALNQSARAANDALIADANVPPAKTGQKWDDTNATPGGFGVNTAAIDDYMASMYPNGASPALPVGDPAHLPASWQAQPGDSAEFVASKAAVWENLVARFCMGCHRTNPKPFNDYTLFQPLAADQDGVALLTKYTSFDPADPQRKTLVGMPQSELMFNTLNGLDSPAGFPTQGLSLTPDAVAERKDARAAIFNWLIQSSNPGVTQTRMTFTIDGADGTQVGDWVYVVGSIPELGAWNPVQGVRCQATAFPTWTCIVNLPRGVAFEWKAVKEFRFGQVVWERERGQGNRHHTVAASITDAVEVTWDDNGP